MLRRRQDIPGQDTARPGRNALDPVEQPLWRVNGRVAGYIRVIAGEMFSGKSTELARLVERSLIAGLSVQVLVPAFAHRGSPRDVEQRVRAMAGRWTITPVPDGNTADLDNLIERETEKAVPFAINWRETLP